MEISQALLFFTILRLILPLTILRWPLPGLFLSMYLDAIDYHPVSKDITMDFYQSWDKIMDSYYLGIAAFTAFFWKEKLARNIAVFAFLYRITGVLFLEITGYRFLLLLFPNFFENFFLFYSVFRIFSKEALFTNKKVVLIVVFSILIPKVLQEYIMHVAQSLPTYVFDLSKLPKIGHLFPRPPETWASLLFYFTLPTLVLIWRLGIDKSLKFHWQILLKTVQDRINKRLI